MSAERSRPRCRPFTLLDAMILIAAVAVGVVGCQDRVVDEYVGNWPRWAFALAELSLMLSSCLVLAFRIRRPRPPVRRIARQPGAVACFAVVAVLIVSDARWLVRSTLEGELGEVGPVGEWVWLLLDAPEPALACVIPIAWSIQAMGRRWRPEPGWIDRAGRVLGWSWIAWGVAGVFLSWAEGIVLVTRPLRGIW